MPRISLKREPVSKTEKPAKVEEVVEEKAPVETKKKEAKSKKVFDQADRILCRSVTPGGLYLDGAKTKQAYSFSDYGDETEIEYRDLVALVHVKSSYLFHPYFVVEDRDFVAEFPNLAEFYAEFYDDLDLEGILELPLGAMIEKLKKLPAGAAENLKVIASSQVADGRLDSVKKIKELNEFFGIDLNLIAELNN